MTPTADFFDCQDLYLLVSTMPNRRISELDLFGVNTGGGYQPLDYQGRPQNWSTQRKDRALQSLLQQKHLERFVPAHAGHWVRCTPQGDVAFTPQHREGASCF